MREVFLDVMRDLSFLSKAGKSGWLAMEWRESWYPWYRWYSQMWTVQVSNEGLNLGWEWRE